MGDTYPKFEAETEEFNVYVVRYDSFFQRETLAQFPYGTDSYDDPWKVAFDKAKEFIKNQNKS